MDRFTCQHVVGISVRNFVDIVMERLTHAQMVCTRPFLLPLKGPGDEASSGADTLEYTPLDMRCMNMAISHSPHIHVPVLGLLCFSTDNHCR